MKHKQLLLIIFLILLGTGLVISVIFANKKNPSIIEPGKPNRIVSLAPNLTEILFKLGLGEKIIGVSSDSNYPTPASEKRQVGPFWQPDIESVIAIRPDLTITLSFEQQRAIADSLSRLGYKTLILKIDTIEELFDAIHKIGIAAGCSENAEILANDMHEKLNKLKMQYDNIEKTKVLWVIEAEPIRVAGRDSFINELIELAGGENAIGSTVQPYPPLSEEDILTSNAQIIIQSAMDSENLEKQQHNAEIFWSKYPNIPAVKNNNIYVIKSDTMLRLGPRLAQGIETIAGYLHPDVMNKSDME